MGGKIYARANVRLERQVEIVADCEDASSAAKRTQIAGERGVKADDGGVNAG